MLLLFPTPHPDELLYSILARYHKQSGNSGTQETMKNLFNIDSTTAITDLNNRLNALSKNLPLNSIYTPEYFIQNHTLFPFYKSFLPQERVSKILNWMGESNVKGDIHKSIGMMASSIPALQFLRYCPICCKDDIEKYGEPYWHRSHQLFGVDICHKHNHVYLIDSQVGISSTYNRQAFIPLYEQYKGNVIKIVIPALIPSVQIYLAKAVHWLLNNEVPVLGLDKIHEKYKTELKANGYVLSSGKVQCRKLANAFIDFYGHKTLQYLNIDIKSDNLKSWWLIRLAHKPRNAAHPLQHLLLLNFLGITPEEFLKPQDCLPSKQAACPCHNPTTVNINERIIKNKPRKKHAITQKKFEKKLKQRKKEWLKIIAENPDKSRNQLQLLFPSEHHWLYLNDKKWLMKNMPEKSKYKKARVDWKQRDDELSVQVQTAIDSIKNIKDKPIRITVGTIGRKIKKHNLLIQQINKLPKTKEILSQQVETYEVFYIRKIRVLIEKKLDNGEIPNAKHIMRIGYLPAGYDKIILKEIENYNFKLVYEYKQVF